LVLHHSLPGTESRGHRTRVVVKVNKDSTAVSLTSVLQRVQFVF